MDTSVNSQVAAAVNYGLLSDEISSAMPFVMNDLHRLSSAWRLLTVLDYMEYLATIN